MEALINLLKSKVSVDEFKIISIDTQSTELFFIKDELQMNRCKDVNHISVTVYKNFEINGKKFKGSSQTKLEPTMSLAEMEDKIDQATLSASFVKNEYYDLVEPTDEKPENGSSVFSSGDPVEHMSRLVKAIYDEDHQFGSWINSCEFFIDINHTRIVNSKGLDVSFDSYRGEIELITEAKNEKESIELFNVLHFSDFDPNWIKNVIKNELYLASLRIQAIPLPHIKDVPVILTGSSVGEFFDYYLGHVSASMIYQQISTSKVGDLIQGKDVTGDLISVTVTPYLKNSIFSSAYDLEGVLLKETELIKGGKVNALYAQKRYADYLKIKPTGEIGNMIVSGGSKTGKELLKEPHLLIHKFSNFQMNGLTGDFGGELRLGIYFDGTKHIPVTLGSISGTVIKSQKDMYLSVETEQDEKYLVPKHIKLNHVSIAGNQS